MSVQTATRVAAILPHVNLLPPEINERKRLTQVQLVAGVALLAAVGAVAFLYMQGTHGEATAKKSLAAAVVDNHVLTAKVAKFGDVNNIRGELAAREAMLSQAMATEITWSDVLGNFATLPTSTWLEQVGLNETVPPGTLTSPTQAPAVVGSVVFKGVGQTYLSLAGWLDTVAKMGVDTGMSGTYFSTASETFIDATKVVDFQASTNLTQAALSGRCVKPGAC